MIFDPSAVSVDRHAFLQWYSDMTDWDDSEPYDDPAGAHSRIRSWYDEISKTFPPLSTLDESLQVDEARLTDYSIGESFIYVGFGWSMVKEAYRTTKLVAGQNELGFYDVSSPAGEVFLPDQRGGLVPITADLNAASPYHFAIWKRSPTAKTAMLAECYERIQASTTHEAMTAFDPDGVEASIREHFRLEQGGIYSAVRMGVHRSEQACWMLVTTTPGAMAEVRDHIVRAALADELMVYDPQLGAVWGNRRPPKPPKRKRA
jgi:hypothetical protein